MYVLNMQLITWVSGSSLLPGLVGKSTGRHCTVHLPILPTNPGDENLLESLAYGPLSLIGDSIFLMGHFRS